MDRELEREGKSLGVITQNIDGLHEDVEVRISMKFMVH